MTTYFVSSEIGSDNNAGTSATAPLSTLQAAADLVKPGDTVEVMNGTYTGNAPGGGDVLDITTSGTASAPITFEAAPGQTPVINSSGGWNAINVQASYIVVNGFTVVGDAANYTLAQALAGYSSGSAELDGNGIAIWNGNHVTIENNTVYNEPGGGIYTEGADYVQILNNVVHDNAHWSAFGNSGISISTSANSDTNAGVHTIISGNLVYGNAQLVPTTGGNTITDGEGIILDTNPGYTGEILVENNTVYGNGSSGIESFDTNNAVITSNTVYGNNVKNVQAASDAQIFINQSNNNTVTNNITTAPNGTPPAAPVISSDVVNSNHSVTLTGSAPNGATVTVSNGGSTPLGTTTASSTGAWTYTTAALAAGTYAFTATDTTSAGTSAASSPFGVTVTSSSSPPPSGTNLVANGNFETGDFTRWTLGGNDSNMPVRQLYIDTTAQGGSTYAAAIGSMGADGTLSQSIATTAGQTYTLSFWLQNEGSTGNDFKAIWNGQTLLSLTNAGQFGYTEYSYTLTATSSTTTLEFSAANNPSNWDLDNISLTANGTSTTTPPAAPVISSGVANSNESVTLTGTAPAGSTVTVSDGGTTALGTATANSTTGAWTYTTAPLSAGSYAFTATDTTSAGTSAASSAVNVMVASSSPPPSGPTVSSIVDSPASGDLGASKTVTLTLKMSENVTVNTTHGTPTLTLNDGGTATYTSGSGSNALTFSYTVGAGDKNVTSLAATTINLNGATIQDGAGNAATLSLTGLTQTGPQIDTSTPTVSSIAESPASGVLNAGKTVTYSIAMSENVTVSGTPQLMLNDGGIASYLSGTGTRTLTFVYTVAAGQNTPDLKVTSLNLNGGSIRDGAGNAANLSLTGLAQGSPAIDTTTPAVPVLSGDTVNGNTVTLNGTAEAGSKVTVFDNSTKLGTATTNSSGAWTYTTGALASGSQSFTATTTDAAGNVSPLSSALAMTLNAQVNLVANGNFETGSFANWTLGGNDSNRPVPQLYIDRAGQGGSTYAAAFGSMGADGTLSQSIATTAGQTYTLSFWLQNEGSTGNDFKAIWNGQTLLSLTNAGQFGYTEYTYTVTATSSATTLKFSAANNPSNWDLDNISLTGAGSTTTPSAVTISKGATLEISAPDSAAVTFTGSTGMLILDNPSTFTGKIFNFTGNGTLSGSDQIDLKNIKFKSVHDSYANGVLTVTDGKGDTAKLSFNGSYTLANFKFASDGSGGTIVYDPPVSTSGSQNTNAPAPNATSTGASGSAMMGTGATFELAAADSESVASTGSATSLPGRASDCATTASGPNLPEIAFGAQTALGYLSDSNWAGGKMSVADGVHNPNIALLGNYMASSFAMSSDGHGGTLLAAAEAAQPDQSLLSHPHHT